MVGVRTRLIEMEPPIVPVVEIFFFWHMISVIFFCKSIPSSTNFFISNKNLSWIPWHCLFFLHFLIGEPDIFCFLEVYHISGCEVFPSWWRILELKEGPIHIKWNLDWPLFLAKDARMINRLPSLQYDKHPLHCVMGSVSSNPHSSTLPTSWIIRFDSGRNGL